MVILIAAEKAEFDEIQHPFMIKTPSKVSIEWSVLNLNKGYLTKTCHGYHTS